MKMSLRISELSRALYRVQGIADKKSTMPILAHVLLNASGNTLTVSATDMDVGVSGSYEANVKTPGAVAVHARQLYDIVKSLPGQDVELEKQDNHWLELRSGAARFRLVGMPADEFPALPSHTQTKLFTIPAAELARMIDRTIFCVSTDDNRHNLSGVFCESPKAKTLRMVATDGHRLAFCQHEFAVDIPIEKGVIVPRKGFQELRRVLEGGNEPLTNVELGFSGNSGVLRAGNVVLTTRLVEGQFPDYEQVIPKGPEKIAKIKRSALGDALKRVSLLSQGRAYGVRLTFEPGKLELVAEDPELGDAHETLDVDYKGERLTIGFNARYILDVLALISDEGVVCELTDDLSPGVLRPIEDRDFLAVVMPMRI
jgi:DNA polymerase III subunit beta